MYIPQSHLTNLNSLALPGKVTIIYGPRRVGKTTLLKQFAKQIGNDALFVLGDDIFVRQELSEPSADRLRQFVGKHVALIIDEAQYIPNIARSLKLMVDTMENIRIIVSGSSSFDLAQGLHDPLTGRKATLHLLGCSQLEISQIENSVQTKANLAARLIYGSYPEVVTTLGAETRAEYLRELIGSYLFKDILAFDGLRSADKIRRLLQILAFQIGKDVSHAELGQNIGMSKNTVDRYLDLLEKTFVIFHRTGFSRNLRSEIIKNKRYYFFDNGIRNALINNFNPMEMRDDTGLLWENYCIAERLRLCEYTRTPVNSWFWRTYDQKEVDLIEERNGKLSAWEFKWNERITKVKNRFNETYPDASFVVINPANYLDFLSRKPEEFQST